MKNIPLLLVTTLLWLNLSATTGDDLYPQKIGAGYSWMPPTNQFTLWYQNSQQGFIFDYNRHYRKFSRSITCRQIDDPTVKSSYTQNLDATTHSVGAGYNLTADFMNTNYIKCGFPVMVYSGFGYLDIKSQQIPEGFASLPDLSNKTFMLLGIKPGITVSWNFHPKLGVYVSEFLDVQIEGVRNKTGENKIEYFNPYVGVYFNL